MNNTITHRDMEMIRLLAIGKEHSEIAEVLHMRTASVTNRFGIVREIIGVNNQIEMIVWWLEQTRPYTVETALITVAEHLEMRGPSIFGEYVHPREIAHWIRGLAELQKQTGKFE